MRDVIAEILWSHHLDELAVFKKCAVFIGPSWVELLDTLKFPDGERTRKQVRLRHAQAVEWFDLAVSSTGLTGPDAFRALNMPPYLGSAFGVPHLSEWVVGGGNKYGRYVFEPATRLRWPSQGTLAATLGVSIGSIYQALKKERRLKGRLFQHAIKRV